MAFLYSFQLAPKVAHILMAMFDNGLDIDKFHIVGHSLGGQLNGIISRHILKLSKGEKQVRR